MSSWSNLKDALWLVRSTYFYVIVMAQGKRLKIFYRLRTCHFQFINKSAESVKKFTAENIETLRIKFTPGVDFDNIRSMAEFNLVASRSGQAEALKAEKEANSLITDGEGSVNDATGENGENSDNGATGENGATDENSENSENGANEEGNV